MSIHPIMQKLAAKHGIKEIAPALRGLVKDRNHSVNVRIDALRAAQGG